MGISVHQRRGAEGFDGGYSTVTRELRRIRGPRFTAAGPMSVPIHTDPGEEAEFGCDNLDDGAARWGWDQPMRASG